MQVLHGDLSQMAKQMELLYQYRITVGIDGGTKMFDIAKASEAQKKYCEKNQDPHFAPKSGRCWSCKDNIYEEIGWKIVNGCREKTPLEKADIKTGITVEEAASGLITGCPHCNRSYCD